MSYLKLPKTTQDHAVGLQSVNQAIDNNDALVLQFDARHSIGTAGYSPPGSGTAALGRHDDILIARTVANFGVDTTPATPVLVPHISGPILGALVYTRMAVGQWRIYLSTPHLFGAVALMEANATADYKATCYTQFSPTTGHAVTVSTWNVATPALEDLPFSLIFWTQTA